MNVPPGTAVVEQGDVGDAFYAVGDGQFEVVVDGRRGGVVRTRWPLRRARPSGRRARAATVRSLTPARVFRLDRTGFQQLVAVRSGHRPSTVTSLPSSANSVRQA